VVCCARGVLAVDLLIVGAGPTGLYAAYYAGFRGLTSAVVDALPEPGGQITAMYQEKMIFDVAGFPAIRGRDLVANLVAQAAGFHPAYLLGQRASTLQPHGDDTVTVTCDTGQPIRCHAVIITAGIGTFTPRPLPVGSQFLGRGLTHFVSRLADYQGRDVIVVGGGDSAFDWAYTLHPLARSVTLVHRRDRFRAHEHTVRQVRDLGVPVLVFSEITAIHGDSWVHSVDVRDTKSGQTRTLPAQAIIAALGFTADLGPMADWGITIERRQIPVDTHMATNVSRVFAAGDIAEYPGKVRLISVGFGEAALAVNNAAVAIDPGAHLFPGHSSDTG